MNESRTHLSAEDITFRPLMRADLPLMHRWLNAPHVARWWSGPDDPTSRAGIAEKYQPLIDGTDRTRAFIFLTRGEPIGYIQTYLIRDEPEYAAALQVPADSAGVDLFIGETSYLHRGLGATILDQFLDEIIFTDPHVGRCVIGPEPANTIAIRAYEKAGFRYLKTVQVPGEPQPEYLLVREKASGPEIAGAAADEPNRQQDEE